MNKKLLRLERESAKYGRPICEITRDICLAEEQNHLIEGTYSDYETLCEAVLDDASRDQGLLDFLNDSAIARMPESERKFAPNSTYCKLERARELLLSRGLPPEFFDKCYKRR